jgi:hypothetical protein
MSKLIHIAKRAAAKLHTVDDDEAQNLANELETAINELVNPVNPVEVLKGFNKALKKAGYIIHKG